MSSASRQIFARKALVLLLVCLGQASAWRSPAPAQDKPDAVVRVNTSLAQTDILVLDKQGRFVEGLKPEQIELRIDGRPRSVAHFDRVVTGSASEDEQLAAARGQRPNAAAAPLLSFDRGRTVLFFIDDYHLSSNSVNRTREMLLTFVDSQMKAEDQVAVVTATGQLGFLEQIVSDKSVLKRAVAKLNHRSFGTGDAERTPMTESEAAAIVNEDRRVIDYFVDQLLREMGRMPRGASVRQKTKTDIETTVKARARSMIDQSTSLAVASLSSFEKLLRLTGDLPWRKTAFFISDGFILHDRSNPGADLRRISQVAARALTVVYAVDALGLSTGVSEASRRVAFDYGRNAGTNSASLTLQQEPLQTLAADTGGRAILNTNTPAEETQAALNENASYYLLSWRLDEKDLATRSPERIEVTIAGRPDLIVRVRHAYSPDMPSAPRPSAKPSSKKEDDPLLNAVQSFAPRIDLPVFLSVGYRKGEQAMILTSTIEVPLSALEVDASSPQQTRELELMGAAVNLNGKPVSVFEQTLNVTPAQIRTTNGESALYSHEIGLAPGLYQIRVAVRDRAAHRIGSAAEWIDIPSGKDASLATSSLFIGAVDRAALESGKLSVNAAHRFRSSSTLGFFLIIYNAHASGNAADVVLQIQILRDDQPVVTKPLVSVKPPATSLNMIPYGEDLSLDGLPAGKYILQVTVIDRVVKSSARQQARFSIY